LIVSCCQASTVGTWASGSDAALRTDVRGHEMMALREKLRAEGGDAASLDRV
jgi:hypothetical protein